MYKIKKQIIFSLIGMILILSVVGCSSNKAKSEIVEKEEETTILQVKTNNLETTTYDINGINFTMILVEGGTFTMGSDSGGLEQGVQVSNQVGEHLVTLSSYLIGETEVTLALWKEVMGVSYIDDDLEYPVASITVPDSQIFIEKLNKIAYEKNVIPKLQKFIIPTEAQWEFAAKGGNQSKNYRYAGSDSLSEVGWTSDDNVLHKVKQLKPNELGIYDMSGNVYEWVADYAHPYSTEEQTNPLFSIPSDNYIKRGGSFYYNDEYRFTTTYRYFYASTDYTIGLRIALVDEQ